MKKLNLKAVAIDDLVFVLNTINYELDTKVLIADIDTDTLKELAKVGLVPDIRENDLYIETDFKTYFRIFQYEDIIEEAEEKEKEILEFINLVKQTDKEIYESIMEALF